MAYLLLHTLQLLSVSRSPSRKNNNNNSNTLTHRATRLICYTSIIQIIAYEHCTYMTSFLKLLYICIYFCVGTTLEKKTETLPFNSVWYPTF